MELELEAIERRNVLQREVDALRRLQALKANYGLQFYRPHYKQHKFHICQTTGRYGRTGNRFGKSELGIAEDIAFCMGGRLWYRNAFDILASRKTNQVDEYNNPIYETYVNERHPGGENHPYVTAGIPHHAVKGLLLVVDWDMAKRIFTNRTDDPRTCGKLWKLLPKDAIGKVNVSRGGHIDMIEIKRLTEYGGGVSTLSIDTIESWKHNKLGGESADWDFIHVDEPCPQAMFKSYSRGLMDRAGRYWFTCTPLDEMWINDQFIPPGQTAVSEASEGLEFKTIEGASRFVITGSIFDNPYRTAKGVHEYMSTLTREERECRLHGIPMAMAGLVYREFIYDLHVLCDVPKGWADFNLPPVDYTIRVAWDVHQRIPQALLYAATAPNGDVFFYDEQFFDPLIRPNAIVMKSRIAGRNIAQQWIDPFAVIPSAVTGESVLDDLMNYDLYFDKASKDLTTGISKVKELLLERRGSGAAVYFSPRLTQTLFEFSHYTFDSDKNQPHDRDNHMMENLYRLVIGGLDYIAPVDDADYVSRRPTTIGFHEHLKPLRR